MSSLLESADCKPVDTANIIHQPFQLGVQLNLLRVIREKLDQKIHLTSESYKMVLRSINKIILICQKRIHTLVVNVLDYQIE